jgi:hypothetical protein
MSAGNNRQLQNRAGANVPSRFYNSALVRAQVPRVLLDDSLGDQLVAECPPGELLFTSGPGLVTQDFGMALGTSGAGLAGKVFLVNAQGEETGIAPVVAPGPALAPLDYQGVIFGAFALSPGEKFIYRPVAATVGKGFLALELYYTDPGPGGVQQSVVDLADGAVKTLFEAPPGKGIQLVPFGFDAPPGSSGCSITTTTDVGTTLDLFLNDDGVDYKIISGFASGPNVLDALGASLGSALFLLSPGQALRAQRVGAAASLKVRSVYQFFNVEDAA